MSRISSTSGRDEGRRSLDERLSDLEGEVDSAVSKNALEIVALRKFVFRMAGFGPEDDVPEGYTLIDAVDDALDRVEELEQLEERLEDVENLAETALGVANAVDDGTRTDGGPAKVNIARRLARNETIRRAADRTVRDNRSGDVEPVGKSAVTVSQVQDMARPDHDVKWKTVSDAFTKLETNWSCFEISNPDEKPKRLQLLTDTLDESLVRAAERDLARDDLANKVVGGNSSDGSR